MFNFHSYLKPINYLFKPLGRQWDFSKAVPVDPDRHYCYELCQLIPIGLFSGAEIRKQSPFITYIRSAFDLVIIEQFDGIFVRFRDFCCILKLMKAEPNGIHGISKWLLIPSYLQEYHVKAGYFRPQACQLRRDLNDVDQTVSC
jgi:hypothetical protein